MAKKNYWKETQAQREYEANKKLNLTMRGQENIKGSADLESVFAWDEPTVTGESGDDINYDVTIPSDAVNTPMEMNTANTTNPSRPRAWSVGYNSGTNTLVIVFRDNTWWQYNNVPVDLWLALKSAPSTGKFLRESGLDQWSDMGPADMDSMSSADKEQFSYTAAIASQIQNTPLYQKAKGFLDQERLPDISQ